MRNFAARLASWDGMRSADDEERARLYELNRPFPGNSPELLKPAKVRALRAFFVRADRRAEPGEVVEVEAHVARDLVGFGRAEYVR